MESPRKLVGIGCVGPGSEAARALLALRAVISCFFVASYLFDMKVEISFTFLSAD